MKIIAFLLVIFLSLSKLAKKKGRSFLPSIKNAIVDHPVFFKISQILTKHYLLFILLIIYLTLAFKDPYSNRSLIPNLEPYNDTLYYSLPVLNWLRHNQFKMLAFDKTVPNIVPPLYSAYLLPFLAVGNNIRNFYVANLMLMLASVALFYAVCQKIFKNQVITFVLGFLLVSNFYFFNLPSLLMAENISLFFTMLAFYLLLASLSKKNLLLSAWIGVLLLLIKSSNLPITIAFYALYILRLLKENRKISKYQAQNKQYLGLFALYLISPIVLYLSYYFLIYNKLEYVSSMSQAFSSSYFVDNFKFYLSSIIGSDTRYLWYQEKFSTPIVFYLTLAGSLVAIFNKKQFLLWRSCMVFVISVWFFMSFFYYPDARYISAVLPMLILPIGFFWQFLAKKSNKLLIGTIVLTSIIYLFFSSFDTINKQKNIWFLKSQVALNFKYKQDPWNYLAVEKINQFFSKPTQNTYLATFLTPFFVEVYANGHYQYLPATSDYNLAVYSFFQQACPSENLIDCYQEILLGGGEIYFTDFYHNGYEKDLNLIKNNFQQQLVLEGCHGACNLYQLSLYRNN